MFNNILFLEKDLDLRALVSGVLHESGYHVICAERNKPASNLIADSAADLIIADIRGERQSGFEILRHLNEIHPPIPSILIVRKHYDETVLRAIRLGVFDLLVEPIRKDDLLQTIKRAEYLFHSNRLKSGFPNLIKDMTINLEFSSKAFQLEEIQKVFQDTLLNYSKMSADDFLTVWLGVEEALLNALEHGNLELKSSWKDELSTGTEFSKFEEMRKKRLLDPVYNKRKIKMSIHFKDGELQVAIEDEGPGFENRRFGQNASHKVYGRGLSIIDSIMDSIEFNKTGNRITLRKEFSKQSS